MHKKINIVIIFLCLYGITFIILGCNDKNNIDISKPDYLVTLIGKDIRGQEFQKFLSVYGTGTILRLQNLGTYYYSYKDKGLSLLFNYKDTLQAIFYYSEGVDNYRQYQGILPKGVTFLDTRGVVEKKLGYPDGFGNYDASSYWTKYKRINGFGIMITYVPKPTMDDSNRIHHISISLPEL